MKTASLMLVLLATTVEAGPLADAFSHYGDAMREAQRSADSAPRPTTQFYDLSYPKRLEDGSRVREDVRCRTDCYPNLGRCSTYCY